MYATASSYFKAPQKPYDANILRPNFLKAQLGPVDTRHIVGPPVQVPAPAVPAPVAPAPAVPAPAPVAPAPVAPEEPPEYYDREPYPATEVPRIGYDNPSRPMHGFRENGGDPRIGFPNPETPHKGYRENLELEWKTAKYANTKDPEVFGPALWFVLHNSAAHYPEKASPIMANQMMGFIKGLPAMIPCASCKEHATAHIEANMANLPMICSGRNNLEKFFVEFHNYVNKRYGKPLFTVEQAVKMYRGGAEVKVMKF